MKQFIYLLIFIYFSKCQSNTTHEERVGPANNYEDRGNVSSCDDYYVIQDSIWLDDKNSGFVPAGVSDCVDLHLWSQSKKKYYDKCCYVRFQIYGEMHAGCVGLYPEQLIDITETIKKMENGDRYIWTSEAANSKIYQLDCFSSYLKFISFTTILLLGLFF